MVAFDWNSALDDFPHWAHAPFATMPDDAEVPALIFGSRSLPEVCPDPPSHWIPGDHAELHLFTDGSCNFKIVSIARHAGFLVIHCINSSPVESAPSPFLLPRGFVGGCSGSQSSNCAEVCAVAQACRHADGWGSSHQDPHGQSVCY